MVWRHANPWSVVVGSTLALVVCNGPVVAFTFGLFLKPISQEFGWNRGAMSAASAVASLMIAITVPFAGILVDRWGARRILLPAIVLSSISVAAISLTPAQRLYRTWRGSVRGGVSGSCNSGSRAALDCDGRQTTARRGYHCDAGSRC